MNGVCEPHRSEAENLSCSAATTFGLLTSVTVSLAWARRPMPQKPMRVESMQATATTPNAAASLLPIERFRMKDTGWGTPEDRCWRVLLKIDRYAPVLERRVAGDRPLGFRRRCSPVMSLTGVVREPVTAVRSPFYQKSGWSRLTSSLCSIPGPETTSKSGAAG